MNEEKIKELEAKIKVLKAEKPRTNREISESIEKLLKELVSKENEVTPLPSAYSITDHINTILNNPMKENYFCIDRLGTNKIPINITTRYGACSLQKYYNPDEYYREKMDSLISMNGI